MRKQATRAETKRGRAAAAGRRPPDDRRKAHVTLVFVEPIGVTVEIPDGESCWPS